HPGLVRLPCEERDTGCRRHSPEWSDQQGSRETTCARSDRKDRGGAGRWYTGGVRRIPSLPACALEQGGEGVRHQDASMTSSSDFRVTLLGTGTPIPRPDRFGPSTLIEAGDEKLLIDAGRGATMRLYQLKVPMSRIDALLLTHYHSDHTVGIPDFWLTGWLTSFYARRTVPLRVIGPVGAKSLMAAL